MFKDSVLCYIIEKLKSYLYYLYFIYRERNPKGGGPKGSTIGILANSQMTMQKLFLSRTKGNSKVRFFGQAVLKPAPNGRIDLKLSMEGSFGR